MDPQPPRPYAAPLLLNGFVLLAFAGVWAYGAKTQDLGGLVGLLLVLILGIFSNLAAAYRVSSGKGRWVCIAAAVVYAGVFW